MRPPRKRLAGRRPRATRAPSLWRVRCMCGGVLEIEAGHDGQRHSCPTCARRFDVRFTEDPATKRKGVSLLYLTDENQKNGASSTVGADTTIFEVGFGGKEPSDAEPELPDEAHFKCSCGVLLVLNKKHYEKRVRCPACKARMLAFLLYNAAARTFNLQLFSLIDQSSGKTQILSKL